MRKFICFIIAFIIMLPLISKCAPEAEAAYKTYSIEAEDDKDQSVYVLGGPSFGTFYTDDNYLNGIIGYERDFYDRWSIAIEIQKAHRTYPAPGNMYSFTPVLRYWFFDFRTIKTYGLGGLGLTTHDLGNMNKGDEYGHRSGGNTLYHIVSGVGIEKKFDWLSLVSEIRYEHGSNLNGDEEDNYGDDKINYFIGIKYNF